MSERDPRQVEVIEAGADEQLLVVAGPGTGKTQVAAMRLVHLMNSGLRPGQVLVLSFSRSAVATLTKRILSLKLEDENTLEDLRHLTIRTFDSWAFRVLRQSGVPVAELLSHGFDKNISSLTELILDDRNDAIASRLTAIRHVIVDEFQDLPGVRSEMVTELLCRLARQKEYKVGFTVLGDPAQAIFRFATRINGEQAPVDPWQNLKTRLGGGIREVVLSKNYRSTAELASIATNMRKILQSNLIEPEKKLVAMEHLLDRLPTSDPRVKLGPLWIDQMKEGSVAILTRTNGEAMRVATMLMGDSVEPPSVSVRLRLAGSHQLPPAWVAVMFSRFKPQTITRSTFDIVYSTTIDHLDETVKDSLHVPTLDVAWCRLARASGGSDTTTTIDLVALREKIEWPDAFPDDQFPDEAAVFVTTVHQAKGMEFDNVTLLQVKEREAGYVCEDPLEEANVGFVAVTRAGSHLGQLPSSCIYKALHEWKFASGRKRQLGYGKMWNLQIGLEGDVAPTSFVSSELHGDETQVSNLQSDLLQRISELKGHKVLLRKAVSHLASDRARDTLYDIHLQYGDDAGLLIGRTTPQLTYDLLDLLWSKGNYLPFKIYNLRIADVVSIASKGETPTSVPEPWRSSRFWLGVTLAGIGAFKTGKRNGN